MTDQCRITRAVPASGDLDPITGLPAATPRTTIYSGGCWVRTDGTVSNGSRRQSAGDVVTQLTSILHIPASAATLKVDDRVEILSSLDSSLLSLVFVVSGLIPGSQMTAQRVTITAVID